MSVPFSLGDHTVPPNPPLPLESPLHIEANIYYLPTLRNLTLYKIPISNQYHFLLNV